MLSEVQILHQTIVKRHWQAQMPVLPIVLLSLYRCTLDPDCRDDYELRPDHIFEPC